MASDGWIKCYRELQHHPAWSHDGMLKLLIHCFFEANFKDSTYLIPGTTDVIKVPRGSFVTGREKLRSSLYPSTNSDTPVSRTIYRWLESLEKMGCITLVTVSHRCTVVSVCNYDTYQSSELGQCPSDVQVVSKSCPTDVPPMSTSEECKNERREEGKNINTPLPPEGGNGEKNKIRSGRQIPEFMIPQVQEIYRAYPRHVGTDAAYKAIAKSLGFCEYETLLAITKRYSERRRRPGNDPKLTPHPATWFNQGRWKDDPTEWDRLDSDGAKGVPVSSDTFFSGIADFVRAHQESEGLNEI